MSFISGWELSHDYIFDQPEPPNVVKKRCNKWVTQHFWRIFFLICVNIKHISLLSSPINTLLSMLLKESSRYLFSFWNYGWKCDLIFASNIGHFLYGLRRRKKFIGFTSEHQLIYLSTCGLFQEIVCL